MVKREHDINPAGVTRAGFLHGWVLMPEMPKTFRPGHLGPRRSSDREYDRNRDMAEQRRWYKTARWQKLKQAVHQRDGYKCQATGHLCIGAYPHDDSPVADHIVEPRGDPGLFWDIENIRTVSKQFHDGERQREQKSARKAQGGGGSKILKPAPARPVGQ